MNVWISTSFIMSKLHRAWPVWINLNVGPSVRFFDTLKLFQIIPAVRCRLNYTVQVSKLRLLKIKLLLAGSASPSNIIRGCWWSYFNSRIMLTRTVCAKVCGCTPGEYTRRPKFRSSVLLKSFVPFTLFTYETVRNIILKLIPINILAEWRCFTFKYIGFHIWHFLPPLFTAGR